MHKLFSAVLASVIALPLLAPAAQAEGSTQAAGTDDATQSTSALPAPVAVPRAAAQSPRGPLTEQQRAMVTKISAYLSSVRTLVGDFVQIGPDGTRSEGKFYLQKPGRIRFEYDSPKPLELISDGQSVAIRDRKLATQDLLLLSQTPLRFLLAEKLDLLKEGNLVNVSSDDVFVTIVLDEKQTLGGTHRLTLMFNAQNMQLRQWTVTDPQGFDTTVALYNLDASKKPDPDLFRINYERLRN